MKMEKGALTDEKRKIKIINTISPIYNKKIQIIIERVKLLQKKDLKLKTSPFTIKSADYLSCKSFTF